MISPIRSARSAWGRITSRARSAVVMAAFVAAGCSDSTLPSPAVARIVFGGESALIGLRGTATLAPFAFDARDNVITTSEITWTSSDPAVATVDDAGVVSGVTLGGPVTVTATVGSVSGSVSVRVVPASLEILPSVTTLAVGASVQLSAQPLDALGDPIPGVQVTWINDAPGVASLDPTTLVLTATAPGFAAVRATAAGRETATSVLTGIPTALDGTFASDPAANTYAEIDVVFGRVTRFFATFRPAAGCSVSVNVTPNAAIGVAPAADENRFSFVIGPNASVLGAFSTSNTVNGSVGGIPYASTSCGPTSGSLFVNYAAGRL